MIIEVVLVIIAVLTLFYYQLAKNRNYWSDRGVKSTTFKFLLGDDGDLFFKEGMHRWALRIYQEFPNEPYIGLWAMFGKPYLMIRNDFELIRSIWIKHFDHFAIASSSVKDHHTIWPADRHEKLMITNLASSFGDEWKNIRYKHTVDISIIVFKEYNIFPIVHSKNRFNIDFLTFRTTFSPVFSSGKLRKMTPLLQEINRKMRSHVSNLAQSGVPFETKDLGGKFSLDGLASCAFGVETGSFDGEESEFLHHGKSVFLFDGPKFLKIILGGMTPNFVKKVMKSLGIDNIVRYPFANKHSKFLMHVIDESYKQRKESKTKRNDILDMMIEAIEGNLDNSPNDDIHSGDQFEADARIQGNIKKKKVSYDDIVATAILLLAAGYDTTGTSMSWIFYDLAMNQNAQDTLYEEIINAGSDANELSYETLQALPYLDAVIHESLRRHVPVAFLERFCTKDFPVPNSKIIIRKGDFVRLNNIGIMLDPEIYTNPMDYNPDRFLKEYAEDRNPYSFLPFSLGPRNCIGMRFAMYEMKCCISSLVSKFRFIPCDKTVAYENLEFSKTDVFGGTTHGLWIKCEER